MRTTTLTLLFMILVLASACAAGTGGPTITDERFGLDGKADGWRWDTSAGTNGTTDRVLSPLEIAADGTSWGGTFDPTRYEAYAFSVDRPTRIVAQFSWNWQAVLSNGVRLAFGLRDKYSGTLMLFQESPSPASDEPSDVWALVMRCDADSSGAPRALTHDIFAPGRFMVVALASPRSYDEAAAYYLTVSTDGEDLRARAPGRAHVAIATEAGRAAAAMRVSIGTSEGITDADGIAVLEDVPAGEHLLKLGPDGLGHATDIRSVFVQGDGTMHYVAALVRDADYQQWTAP
jgi:hypothetical protein